MKIFIIFQILSHVVALPQAYTRLYTEDYPAGSIEEINDFEKRFNQYDASDRDLVEILLRKIYFPKFQHKAAPLVAVIYD